LIVGQQTMARPKRPQKRKSEGAHLPDPKKPTGPYRPFTSDPGWAEAWWWLWLPILYGVLVILACAVDPKFYRNWIIPEGFGFLEFSQFLIIIAAFVIAVRLLFDPFVRKRPFVLTVTIIAALSSLYIAGEETSWGQHFFHWNTPGYWATINQEDETNLHKAYDIFDKVPRVTLELGVVIGGLLIPLAAALNPWMRASRISLFLPPAALVPTAACAMFFKLLDELHAKNYFHHFQRASETIESYLFYFILAYLIVFQRRIREIETEERTGSRS
jgi:hypothetical protein